MLLDQVQHPSELKKLKVPQLETLAKEIRQFLIQALASTGGHLAPNLGVVELTIAMHYLFDSPKDKIIFDVGHQAYVHKLLTGRKDQFPTLRKYKGLSGFLKRKESEHDVWEAGHSSTSLSAAIGMAIARDRQGLDYNIVALIGDGALTGGMAFEALNHIGHEKRKLMVILNDNEMSIAPNVGALHNYLTRLRSDKNYLKAKEEVEALLKKVPAIGGKLAVWAERMKDSLKYLIVSGVLFEELGLKYFGPIDGHDIPLLLETLSQAKKVNGPTLVHVVTRKGKGFAPAEADSHKWHGASAYKIESGQMLKSQGPPMYTEIFGRTLIELADRDERIVAITPAMPGGSGLLAFAEKFPGRMFDVGIAEQHAATISAAMALEGLKPVFAVYSTFLQRAYDQVVHDICRQNANVVFAIDRAGFVGPDGDTHHGVYDIAYLRHIPNLVLMMPKDENELRHMLYTAVQYEDGPIAVRYPRIQGQGVQLDEEFRAIPIGTWETVRDGTDVVALAVGPMVGLALEAAAQLEKEGVNLRVVNARFLKPLDEDMLAALADEKLPILSIEEGSVRGGFGSAVLEWFADHDVHGIPLKTMGVPDRFIEHGSIADQRAESGLTVEALMVNVRSLAALKPKRSSTGRLTYVQR